MSEDQRPLVQPAQQPEDVPRKLNPYFPEVVGSRHLFQILARNPIQFLNQLQCPRHFLRLLSRQAVQELLNRTIATGRPVKVYLMHMGEVNIFVNIWQGE